MLNKQLIKAIEKGNVADIKDYLKQGAEADARERHDTPILHLIIQSAKFDFNETIELVDLLIDGGEDINATDDFNNTALHCAAQIYDGLDIIKELIIRGIKIGLVNDNNETAREIAEMYAHDEIEAFLADEEALFEAIEDEDLNQIEERILACTNVNTTDNDGTPVLHLIVKSNMGTDMITTAIDSLIARRVDINIRDKNDDTALHIAAGLDFGLQIVEKLVENGADFELRDSVGDTPCEIAGYSGQDDIEDFLLAKEEELEAPIAPDPVAAQRNAKPILMPNISYEASKDLTTVIRNGHPGMGWAGYLKQIAQLTPTKVDIREYNTTVGGFHEIIPTKLRVDISKIANDARTNPPNKLRNHVAQVQAGARMSTNLTFFNKLNKNDGKGEIAAHSGAFGTAHTTGQAPAHKLLEETAKAAWGKQLMDKKLIVAIVRKQLELMPPAEKFLTDRGITGKTSSLADVGEIKAPSANDTVQKTSERFKLANKLHIGRERTKQRLRTLKRSIPGLENPGACEGRATSPARIASPSPERRSTFFTNPQALEPLPLFPGTFVVANQAAWVTQPLRLQP